MLTPQPVQLTPAVEAVPIGAPPGTTLAPMIGAPDGIDPAFRAARTPAVTIKRADGTGPSLQAAAGVGRAQSVGLPLTDSGATPAQVSLRFQTARSGSGLLIHPVDGGVIDGSTGSRTFTIPSDGAVTFTFQPPARAGLYHIVLRLDDIITALPFWALSPALLASDQSPAALVLPVATSTATTTTTAR